MVANGHMSEETEVVPGVPQGTVLAMFLFVIMTSDIDEKVVTVWLEALQMAQVLI